MKVAEDKGLGKTRLKDLVLIISNNEVVPLTGS